MTDPDDSDTDDDTLTDGAEVNDHGTNPTNNDTDGDRLNDSYELHSDVNTNPKNSDTDNDGLSDGWELQYNGSYGVNPLIQANRTEIASDSDNDG